MSREKYRTPAGAIITMIVLVGTWLPSWGQTFESECDFDGGKIEYNICVQKKLEEQLSKMKGNKACSSSSCLYRLRYMTYGASAGYEEHRYGGAGFEFVILFKPDGDNLEATLYDANGGTTIVETCETHWCYGRYQYKSGPLEGAKLSRFNYASNDDIKSSFWILELPR
jgi:hypothetical protein